MCSDMSKLAIRAGVLIALHVHSEHGFAWPGYDRIQSKLGCTKSALVRAVKELEAGRFFHVSRPAKPGRGRAVEFRPLAQDRRPDGHLSGTQKGDEMSAEKVTKSSNIGDEMVTPLAERYVDGSAEHARERRPSNQGHGSRPSNPRSRHRPAAVSSRGRERASFGLADAALEYFGEEG